MERTVLKSRMKTCFCYSEAKERWRFVG